MKEVFMGKVYDGIIGLATGDALGVPVEFETRKNIMKSSVTTMLGYGTHYQPAGTWSDDTSMTLALLDSIARNHGIDYKDIMDRFSEWLLYGEYTATGEVFDVGNTTSRAIMNYGHGINPIECGGKSEYENGNGSLMRILPIAYYIKQQAGIPIESQMEIIHNVSSLTHGHRISLAACGIYITIALELLSGGILLNTGISNGIEKAFQYYYRQGWNEISVYSRVKNLTSFVILSEREINSSGYVVDTLEAAIWCLLTTNSYKEGVLKAVNLGDDTDTTGAVAGGLAGIYYGAKNIPQDWLGTILKRNYIKSLCDNLEN